MASMEMIGLHDLLNEEISKEVISQLEYESKLADQATRATFLQSEAERELVTRTSTYGYISAVVIQISRFERWSFDLQAFRKAMLRGAAVCVCAVLWADRRMAQKAAEREQAQAEAGTSAPGRCFNCGVALNEYTSSVNDLTGQYCSTVCQAARHDELQGKEDKF